MLYCTYDQYQTAGGTLDEAAFTPLCFRASKLIDRNRPAKEIDPVFRKLRLEVIYTVFMVLYSSRKVKKKNKGSQSFSDRSLRQLNNSLN